MLASLFRDVGNDKVGPAQCSERPEETVDIIRVRRLTYGRSCAVHKDEVDVEVSHIVSKVFNVISHWRTGVAVMDVIRHSYLHASAYLYYAVTPGVLICLVVQHQDP